MQQVPCMKHDAGILHLLFRLSYKVLNQNILPPSPLGKSHQPLKDTDGFYVLECFNLFDR